MKGVLHRFLVAGGAPALWRLLHRDDAVILTYHNVVPDRGRAAGDASLHLPRRDFARQLDLLAETHRVVPLSEVLGPPGDGEPRAAVTFDDAYRGAVTTGVEELSRRGLPATIFVAPGLLGRNGLWWDELAPEGGGGLPAGLREEALTVARGMAEEVYAWADRRGLERREPPAHAGVATEDELAEAVAGADVTLGSHGWSHGNLARLGDQELRNETTRPLAWLQERFPAASLPWLSLPYGRSGPGVEEAARDAGYAAVLRISGGLAGPGTDRWAVPRVNVPAGISEDGFVLRAAGL